MHTSSEATKSEVLQGGGHDQSFDLLKALGLVIPNRLPPHPRAFLAEFLMSRYAKRRLASALGLSFATRSRQRECSHRVRYRPKTRRRAVRRRGGGGRGGGHGGDGPGGGDGAPARCLQSVPRPHLE